MRPETSPFDGEIERVFHRSERGRTSYVFAAPGYVLGGDDVRVDYRPDGAVWARQEVAGGAVYEAVGTSLATAVLGLIGRRLGYRLSYVGDSSVDANVVADLQDGFTLRELIRTAQAAQAIGWPELPGLDPYENGDTLSIRRTHVDMSDDGPTPEIADYVALRLGGLWLLAGQTVRQPSHWTTLATWMRQRPGVTLRVRKLVAGPVLV